MQKLVATMEKSRSSTSTSTSTYVATRPVVLGLAKVFFLAVAQIPLVRAAPFHASSTLFATAKDEPKTADDPNLWLYLGVAAILVLLGGAFAGLTIALMGQVRHVDWLRWGSY